MESAEPGFRPLAGRTTGYQQKQSGRQPPAGPRDCVIPGVKIESLKRLIPNEGRVLKPSPVGAYAAAGESRFKAEDQAGNVWEWTSSLYLPYPYRRENSEKPEVEGERVMRGSSWDFNRRGARCACCNRNIPGLFINDVGFRVFSPGTARP